MMDSTLYLITFIWLGAFLGFCAGTIWARSMYRHILKAKAVDGTAECIHGKFYYIVDERTYCRDILGIEKESRNEA